jgi:hypothetical protein
MLRKMRWMSGESERNGVVSLFIAMAIIVVVMGIFWGIFSLISLTLPERLVHNTITQSNHMQVVRLKKDTMTLIALDAKWEQKLDLADCDDYSIVAVEHVTRPLGRYSQIKGINVYLNVKKPFNLQLKYLNERGKSELLYTKLTFKEDKK